MFAIIIDYIWTVLSRETNWTFEEQASNERVWDLRSRDVTWTFVEEGEEEV